MIGAGPAGLVTAKTLIECGADVTIFEKGSCIGGTWVFENDNGRRFLYRNLHINTSKRLTAFSDHPFPPETQPIPDHRDMARYMQGYAERFGLVGHIRFRSPVTRLQPLPESSQGWLIEVDGQSEEAFDAAVVCSGLFDRPRHLTELRETFQGTYLHSADYRAPEDFAGKRVCVVGAGNSAVDIASDVCRSAAAVVLIARSPVFIVPHFVWGLSLGDIGAALRRRWIPDRLRRTLLAWLVRAVHGRMTQLGVKPLVHRVHPTISSTIVQDVLFRRVTVKHGLDGIEGKTLRFSDGSAAEFDVVIGATGYITDFPFLAEGTLQMNDGRLPLYKRIALPGYAGLYFSGMINLDTPINYACEQQAKWIAGIELGEAVLPDAAAMAADIEVKDHWAQRLYGTAHRHSVQDESMPYYRELAASLRDARRRARSLRSRRVFARRGAMPPLFTRVLCNDAASAKGGKK